MGGAICSEMESSVLFILGNMYKLRTGGIMCVTGNQENKEPITESNSNLGGLINTTIEALRILIRADRGQ